MPMESPVCLPDKKNRMHMAYQVNCDSKLSFAGNTFSNP